MFFRGQCVLPRAAPTLGKGSSRHDCFGMVVTNESAPVFKEFRKYCYGCRIIIRLSILMPDVSANP
jgi:hypothetical protein